VEGVASPATDLVGLNAFAEHMSELEQELIASVFNKHGDLTAEAKKLLGDIKQLLPDWQGLGGCESQPEGHCDRDPVHPREVARRCGDHRARLG